MYLWFTPEVTRLVESIPFVGVAPSEISRIVCISSLEF